MCSSPMETTRLNALLRARLTALAMEEFPQHSPLVARAPPNWHPETQFTCAGIPEEEEEEGEGEGVSNLEEEEERARRSFQQSLDSLCWSRSGQWRHWQDCCGVGVGGRVATQVSLDSSDSDSV